MDKRPIGIFDSGVGGLSVWRELVKLLPGESYCYFADSGHAPYGLKSPEKIIERAVRITEFLLTKNCKMIVVACNAVTSSAIHYLRQYLPVPLVGIEPAVKPAAVATRTGHIGVLTTARTSQSDLFHQTCEKYAADVTVHVAVGNGLVEFVESGTVDSKEAAAMVRRYIEPLLEQNVDQIVLGCTHYPFLRSQIEKITRGRAALIDPAPAIAAQTLRVMEETELLGSDNPADGTTVFYTTGSDANVLRNLIRTISPRSFEIFQVDV